MSLFKSLSIDDIRQRGTIRDVDVQSMRRNLAEDGAVSALEADLLLMLNTACRIKDASWTHFFVDTLSDYVVHQAAPEGYVTAANAEWLTLRFSRDGKITNHAELELIVSVLEQSRWAPMSLPLLVMRQLRDGIITGHGPLRTAAPIGAGAIGDAEVTLARRLLMACDDALPVTRAEAEALFDINSALRDPAGHPGWTDLYVAAIANAVMWAAGYAVPGRQDALCLPATGSTTTGAPASVELPLGVTVHELTTRIASPQEGVSVATPVIFSTSRPQSAEERALARLERQRIEIITHDEIAEPDIDWLVNRIGHQISDRGERVGLNEHKLLARIERESPVLHPALVPLMRLVA